MVEQLVRFFQVSITELVIYRHQWGVPDGPLHRAMVCLADEHAPEVALSVIEAVIGLAIPVVVMLTSSLGNHWDQLRHHINLE